jgi:hypothetical protein
VVVRVGVVVRAVVVVHSAPSRYARGSRKQRRAPGLPARLRTVAAR